jgi:glycosyltransferase involved in cell wall biosynthesis
MHNRLVELNRRGYQIHLTSWDSLGERDARLASRELKSICADCWRFRVSHALRLRAILRAHLPFGVATHHLNHSALQQLAENASQRNVCAVVLDGIYGAPAALAVARLAGLPLIYRSHNIEWRHMLDQVRSASSSFKKLRYLADSVRMKRLEEKVRTSAVAILEICEEDLELQEDVGPARRLVMRPILNSDTATNTATSYVSREMGYDVVFAGNLHNPNNLEGLEWLAEKVVPLLHGKPRVMFAGSDPVPALRRIAAKANATIASNPADMAAVRSSATVLVNPTQRASGINLKTVEMLASGMPVVCTTAAMRGIPKAIQSYAGVADSAADFAFFVNKELSERRGYLEAQARAAYSEFGPSQVDLLEEVLQAV